MGKFDSFKKKMSDVADKATDKAKDLAEIGKLNMSLADKRKDLDKAYTKLGKGFFEKEENLETSEAYLEAEALVKEIADLQTQIEALKNKVPEAAAEAAEEVAETVTEVKENVEDAKEDLSDLTKCIKNDEE